MIRAVPRVERLLILGAAGCLVATGCGPETTAERRDPRTSGTAATVATVPELPRVTVPAAIHGSTSQRGRVRLMRPIAVVFVPSSPPGRPGFQVYFRLSHPLAATGQPPVAVSVNGLRPTIVNVAALGYDESNVEHGRYCYEKQFPPGGHVPSSPRQGRPGTTVRVQLRLARPRGLVTSRVRVLTPVPGYFMAPYFAALGCGGR